MPINSTDEILRQALHACAEATDKIVPGKGQGLKDFADELYVNEEKNTPADRLSGPLTAQEKGLDAARQQAIDALTQQNPRFKLYWDQGDRSREPEVKFWANEFAANQSKIEELKAALGEIATHPHISYDHPSNSDNQYGIGCADGHRCAANIARAALE